MQLEIMAIEDSMEQKGLLTASPPPLAAMMSLQNAAGMGGMGGMGGIGSGSAAGGKGRRGNKKADRPPILHYGNGRARKGDMGCVRGRGVRMVPRR